MPLVKQILWVVDCEIAKMCFPFFANRSHKQKITLSVIPLSDFDCTLILFEFAAVDEHKHKQNDNIISDPIKRL